MDIKIKASIISSIAEISVIHPIDYIKTLKQKDKNTNIIKALKTPYIGIYPRLIGTVPMRFLFWNSLNNFNQKGYKAVVSGFYTSILQTFIDYPIELSKTQKINNNIDFKKSFKNINHIGSYSTHLSRNALFAVILNYSIQKDPNSYYIAGLSAGIASLISQPFDSLKTWYQSGNYKYPKNWNFYNYMRGYEYRCSISIIGMNIGWIIFYKLSNI